MIHKNIKLISNSHIAKESAREIKKAFEDEIPDLVAVELDLQRMQGLLTNQSKTPPLTAIFQIGVLGYLFALIGGFLQKKLGGIVGAKPGIEMLEAIKQAKKHKMRIFLIDQDLRITLKKLSKISFKEKMKLGFELVFGFLRREKVQIDLDKVPPTELVEKLILHFKKILPEMYKVLVTDRNKVMANNIIEINKKFPNQKILVVVGAGHSKGMMEILKKKI